MVDRSRSTNSGNRRIPGAERAVDLSRAREREVEPDVLSRPVDAQEAFTPYFPNGINLIDASEEEPTFVTITVDDFTEIAGGIEAVAALPTLPDARYGEGVVVFLTTDDKLYRSDGSDWSAAVAAVDITGQITTTQITDDAITTPKIAANAVTAAEIQANTITADEIATNAITADEILAGAVSTSELAADAVTAAKLAAIAIESGKYIQSTSYVAGVSGWKILADGTAEFNNVTIRGKLLASQATLVESGVNLATNPGAETDTTGWTGSNCTLTRTTVAGEKRTGSGAFKLSITSSGTRAYMGTATGTSGMAVTPGSQYFVRFYGKAGTTTASSFEVSYLWYDAGGSLIGSENLESGGAARPTTATWAGENRFPLAPGSAAYLAIRIGITSSLAIAGQTVFFDDVTVGVVSSYVGKMQTSDAGPFIAIGGTSGLASTILLSTGRDDEAIEAILQAGHDGTAAYTLLAAPQVHGTPAYINLKDGVSSNEMEIVATTLDLSQVGSIPGLWRVLDHQTVTGSSVASIVCTPPASGYMDLRFTLRLNATNAADQIARWAVNGDTTDANYFVHWSLNGVAGTGSLRNVGHAVASTDRYSVVEILVPNYLGTANWKQAIFNSHSQGTASNIAVGGNQKTGGTPAAAITTITFSLATNNIEVGSSVTMEGLVL